MCMTFGYNPQIIFCHFFSQFELSHFCALNSLLVKRQIDNPSPGTVTGGN